MLYGALNDVERVCCSVGLIIMLKKHKDVVTFDIKI